MESNELTIRDRFALAALTGLLASPVVSDQIIEASGRDDEAFDALTHHTAADAWKFADALLAARP